MREPARRLDAAEEYALHEALAKLLIRQGRLYAANESGSLPQALCRELLCGMLYCLGLRGRAADGQADAVTLLPRLSGESGIQALSDGQETVRQKALRGYVFWQELCRMRPAAENRARRDTLASIGRGFSSYDPIFFAHRFACEIDYPLVRPVSEEISGIDFIACYLHRIAAEDELLRAFPFGAEQEVLARAYRDWRGLVVNLYAPIAANALVWMLLHGEVRLETLSEGEWHALSLRWMDAPQGVPRQGLLAAADALTERMMLSPGGAAALRTCAEELAVRAFALRKGEGLRGLFV